ncbi:hypothetical protein EYS14_15110 [Alteromonadaceae bacterium M269]|nr:hypothetical protein EYS14_15110 [Alteromonadaceae bacterium M269]
MSCVFCWRDKDTLGALLILLGYWLIAKVLIVIPDTWQYWLLVYGMSAGICVYYFNHITAKVALIVVLFSVMAEWLWWQQEYANKPEVFYHVGLLTLTVWVRQLLFNRIFIAHEYFNYTSGKTGLDTHARGILFASFTLILLTTLEYFVRHVSGLGSVTTIYYLFTPVSTIISGIMLAVIYMHYFNNQSKKYLSA